MILIMLKMSPKPRLNYRIQNRYSQIPSENGGYVEYKIYSDSSKLPFDINTISEFDSLSKMYGTFTGSFSSTSPFKNQKYKLK